MDTQDNQHLTRQFDLIPLASLRQKLVVIGAGAIGSFTVLSLAKMGFSDIEVWDADEVSVENMNSQFYRFKDIGKLKVDALHDLVKDFTGVEIQVRPRFYERGQFSGIVISAVDSMAVRKLIWEQQYGKAINCAAVIDPRMGAEEALMYVRNPMSPDDNEDYQKVLYSDESAVHERCTAKATMYTATMLSGLVAKAVKDLAVTGETGLRSVQWSIKHNEMLVFDGKPRQRDIPDYADHVPTRDYGADIGSAWLNPPTVASSRVVTFTSPIAAATSVAIPGGRRPGLTAAQITNEALALLEESREPPF